MKLIFAKNIGFCFGVKRAISIARNALEKDPRPVQFLGSLIHNEKITEEIIEKGGIFINDLLKAKPGTIVLRAHGTPLNIIDQIPKNITIRDTVCPLVKKAQLATDFFYKNGYQVIIIGDKTHPETKAIKSYAHNKGIVVQDEIQAQNLPRFKKIGIVSQTTQNIDKIAKILKIMRKQYKELKWENTLCPEVSSRQKELREILKKADGIIIIGSHSSANTTRLAEIVKNHRKRLWWVNSVDELRREDFKELSTIGVASGTSAPDWEVEKIKKWLFNY